MEIKKNANGGGNNAVSLWIKSITEENEEDFGYKCNLFHDDNNNAIIFPKNTFSLIMARPGNGKTTVLVSLAMDSVRQGKKILFVTNEEEIQSIIFRMITNEFCYEILKNNKELLKIKIPNIREYVKNLIKNKDTQKENNDLDIRLLNAIEKIKNLNSNGKIMFLDPDGLNSYNELLNEIGKQDEGTIIFYDYMQKVRLFPTGFNSSSDLNSVLRVISGDFATLMKNKKLIGIAAAQGNRQGEGQNGEADELNMSNLAESGALERDATVIIGIGSVGIGNEIKRFYRIIKNRRGTESKKYFINTSEQFSGQFYSFSFLEEIKILTLFETQKRNKKSSKKTESNKSETKLSMSEKFIKSIQEKNK